MSKRLAKTELLFFAPRFNIYFTFQEFDVEKNHLDMLIKNNIAELDPSDPDMIRLVDFTE